MATTTVPDLALQLGEAIVAEARKVKGLDRFSAFLVDDASKGPVPGMATWQLLVTRPSESVRGTSGGAYARTLTVRLVLFASQAADKTREALKANRSLGFKAVQIRSRLEGKGFGILNVALFGTTGPSELQVYQTPDGTSGMHFVDWYMRGERWMTLAEFQCI